MRMPHSATLALVAGSALAAAALAHSGRHSPKEPQHFTVNKLLAPVLQRLPVGGVIPAGWLKDELALQAKGISGSCRTSGTTSTPRSGSAQTRTPTAAREAREFSRRSNPAQLPVPRCTADSLAVVPHPAGPRSSCRTISTGSSRSPTRSPRTRTSRSCETSTWAPLSSSRVSQPPSPALQQFILFPGLP